jgi:FtsP/CotA-like multicopper oxidase with cupredoxin domain
MVKHKQTTFHLLLATIAAVALLPPAAGAQDGMAQEQAEERREMGQMKDEIQGIKSEMNDAIEQINQVGQNLSQPDHVREIHLFVKRAACEVAPGVSVDCLTYNGKMPGPIIRAGEGEAVRVVLHNQSDVATSLSFQGLLLPQNVAGLPRKGSGLVEPGQTYAYQFVAKQPGTYWYHPQINHADQKGLGLAGALVIDGAGQTKSYDRELVVILGSMRVRAAQSAASRLPASARPALVSTSGTTGGANYFLFNGKSAPAIPAVELHEGERVRLRVINAGQIAIPLSLSGHRFEVVAVNGSDQLEPHTFRDTVTLNPSDRYDLEFTANNPGVWSLSSELFDQSTTEGRFPGGIACVVRYGENK